MLHSSRRSFVQSVAWLPTLLVPSVAQATLMRGLKLRDLTARSQHVLLLTPLASQCTSVALGGRQVIVTDTSVRVDDVIERARPSSSTLVVRTLGGIQNGAGLLVHGQAELSIGAACVAFLTSSSDGRLWVTGMAQGHFPLENSAKERYLKQSPRLPELLDFEHSGVRALVGRGLTEARQLVHEAATR